MTGVPTERFGFDAEQGWLLMVRLSTRTNLKAREIARLLEAEDFSQLANEDLTLAARLNEHLPSRSRLPSSTTSRWPDHPHDP
jgi:hypothetical protein